MAKSTRRISPTFKREAQLVTRLTIELLDLLTAWFPNAGGLNVAKRLIEAHKSDVDAMVVEKAEPAQAGAEA
jgi:hypothetical protein